MSMIGFNYLGKMGQLGNQMFQYASLRGIANNRGFDFCIPYHQEVFDDGIGNKLRIELFDPFMMSNVTQSNIAIIDSGDPRTEGGHNFNEVLFNTCPDNVSLHGYFQTEKYFKNIDLVKTIIKLMGSSEDLIEYVEDRPGHDLRYAIDNAKIKNALSFHPQHTLEEGLAKTIIWYKYDRI